MGRYSFNCSNDIVLNLLIVFWGVWVSVKAGLSQLVIFLSIEACLFRVYVACFLDPSNTELLGDHWMLLSFGVTAETTQVCEASPPMIGVCVMGPVTDGSVTLVSSFSGSWVISGLSPSVLSEGDTTSALVSISLILLDLGRIIAIGGCCPTS